MKFSQKNKKVRKTKKVRKIKKTRKTLKNKHYKKNKIGGGYDELFTKCFDNNLNKVETAIQQFSGKHSIDMTIANEFISSQISPIRRQAAKDLIDNTIYITLEEIDTIIEKLVDKLYTEYPDINSSNNIYIVTGNIKKSSYFLSVLALKYIRAKQYKEPFKFIESINPQILEEIGNNPIIMIDDVSYSGSQLSEQLNKTYYDTVITGKKSPPNIYILLAALNDISKQKLSKVPITKVSKVYDEFAVSPFKLLYLEERLYEPLIYKLGIERYFNMVLFFSTFSAISNVPFVSIYLDHKLADEVSTFTTTLLYGQVIPNNAFLNNLYDNDCLLFDTSYKDFDINKINTLLTEFNSSNRTTFKSNQYKSIGDYVLKKLIKNDIPDKQGLPYLSFKPFINTCNTNPNLLQNIQDPEIINFDYFLFIMPEGCVEGNDCSLDFDPTNCYKILLAMDIGQEDTEQGKNLAKEKLNNAIMISKKINSYRCPQTWYKKGQFEMTCIS
jgi:hypothetical protein